jgi:hypothetical protein
LNTDWIKTQYDRALLIAAVVLLFLSSIFIWRGAAQFSDNLVALQHASAPQRPSLPGMASALEAAARKMTQSPQWTFSGRSGLFVPEKHFIGADGTPATLQTTEVHAPVPNEWLEQFGLPIEDADVLEQDPDRDGFSNFDEWQDRTNPIDKNSHPDYLTKLRVKSIREEPFRLLFSAWVDTRDGVTFQINTIDFTQPTQFLKVGDIIGGTRFKIAKFTEKHTKDKYGTDVDISELGLEQVDTHDHLMLVKEKVATSPESVVEFAYSWPAGQPPQEFQVRKDQEFSLKPNEHIKYKLADAQQNKAVIEEILKPDQKIEIGLGQ